MRKLMSELTRLYEPAGTLPPDVLEQRLLGHSSEPVRLATEDGFTRALVIGFKQMRNGDEAGHWQLLCSVANALQTELGLPAPAVSISGADGYALWLSFEAPVPQAQAERFTDLLRMAYFPALDPNPVSVSTVAELPPCLHPVSGKWAAFINPGLGASFAGDTGLDMPPPFAGQIALLEGLHSISPSQLAQAIETLRQAHCQAPAAAGPEQHPPARTGLLLADASIEDIVRHLHAMNIEPSFRYLMGKK